MNENAAPETVRLVTTGHDDAGRGVVATDARVETWGQRAAGYRAHIIWGTDEISSLHYPDDGLQAKFVEGAPGLGGLRFAVLRVPPDSDADSAAAAALSSESRMAGMHGSAVPDSTDAPDMHFTATVDLCTVIEGTVVLCLDDDRSVTLEKGDCLVQQGTRHRWRNPGSTTALVATTVVAVPHAGAGQ
jgi:mannose-6-phosphate isomerase-like protein (cupin superfamily)